LAWWRGKRRRPASGIGLFLKFGFGETSQKRIEAKRFLEDGLGSGLSQQKNTDLAGDEKRSSWVEEGCWNQLLHARKP